jgi:hypothetical protein
MKRPMSLFAVLLLVAASVLAFITYQDEEQEAELVKALRDPDRVDKRWVYVTGLATAGVCFGLWTNSRKRS